MWRPAGTFSSAGPRATAAVTAVTCVVLAGMLVLTAGHPSNGGPGRQQAASGKVVSAYFRKLARERRALNGSAQGSVPPEPVELLTPDDLFVAVKSTGRFHRQRLDLLLDTWISRHMQQVTDSFRSYTF